MSQPTLLPSSAPARFQVITAHEAKIREYSMRAAQMALPRFHELEQRTQQRVAYPRLIPLTPLQEGNLTSQGSPIYVVGKHLAVFGLDFFHRDPIPQRYVVASLETGHDQWIHFLLKITWCRFLRSNWYDSGGRFVKVLEQTTEESSRDDRNFSPAVGN